MIFKRFYDPKLAQASYLIGCPATQEALLVDPNRGLDRYIQAAAEDGLRVAHVTETHIHADFVSGARELAARTGARLYLSGTGGADWQYHYAGAAGATLLQDGDRFRVGRVQLSVLHVPGHTPEHLAFLVTDTEAAEQPMGALTGDFIFVGDVGRPDLLERAVGSAGTMEQGARQLYRSLQRFRQLDDFLQIWPGHGAGSACGKSLSAVPQSTLGYEKRFNWAFKVAEESEFVRAVLAGQPDPPRYFAQMKKINQRGPRPLAGQQPPARHGLGALVSVLAQRGTVVDTREPEEYRRGSVPGTINIPDTRAFTTWAGSVLPYGHDFYLIVNGREQRAHQLFSDLAGIGLDQLAGYFGGEVVKEWESSRRRLQSIPSVTVNQLAEAQSGGSLVLDVRGAAEWSAGHIPGSLNLPVAELEARSSEIPRDRKLVVHCQTGLRAAIAVSLLRAAGFEEVSIFPGGFAQWRSAGQAVATNP